MRAIMRAKRRSNEQIMEDLKAVYPRVQVWTYTKPEKREREWIVEIQFPNEQGTRQVIATKLEDLERWLHKHYPYIRGKKQ